MAYVYANTGLSLVNHPVLNAALYAVLLAFRTAPLGVAAMYLSPAPAATPESIHCSRLALVGNPGVARRWVQPVLLLLRGQARVWAPAAALMFTLSFQEFEMARLMQVLVHSRPYPATWTVSVF